eukprot:g1592.t1
MLDVKIQLTRFKLIKITIWITAIVVLGNNAFASAKAHKNSDTGDVKQVKKVYVLFSNHLDIGYTMNVNGSTSGAVINEYFHKYFPKAIAVAEEARQKKTRKYSWMTHSWLVDAFRNCESTKINRQGPNFKSDLICPNSSAVKEFEMAVRRGDINYHAFPFNAEPELFTPELFDSALNLTFRQDLYFGHAKRKTLSQRDVPGLTRAAIPLLRKRGIEAVSVGENAQCAPSAVPPIFVWKDNATNTSLIAMFHALGYGGAFPSRRRRRQLLVSSEDKARLHEAAKKAANFDKAYKTGRPENENSLFYVDQNGDMIMRTIATPFDDGPGIHIGDVDGKVKNAAKRNEACVTVEDIALCYAWKIDNSGPHSYADSKIIFGVISNLFPHAEIVSSDAFDDFITDIMQYKDTLPVVTQEIGDTWIMGITADPKKVALFRACSRIHSKCVLENTCIQKSNNDTIAFRSFERLLMVAGEHTWGWNGGDTTTKSWTNEELENSLKTDLQFQQAVIGWTEQRSILRNAIAALPSTSTLAKELTEAINGVEKDIVPYTIDSNKMKQILLSKNTMNGFDKEGYNDTNNKYQNIFCGKYQFGFSDQDGSINLLKDSNTGKIYADSKNTLGKLWYQGMGKEYFKKYVDQYIAGISGIWPEVTAEGLYKPGLNVPPISSFVTLKSIHTDNQSSIILNLNVANDTAHNERGAPKLFQVNISCNNDVDNSISYIIRWFNKTRSHVPETIWLLNNPKQLEDLKNQPPHAAKGRVGINKLSSIIDPIDVDLECGTDTKHLTCGVHLHGIGNDGIIVKSKDGISTLRIKALDSPLVSIGRRDPVPTPLVVPQPGDGINFALVGNIWNTNYPFWYPFNDEDLSSQFRFIFELN